MRKIRDSHPAVDAAIGYAADGHGCGVAYARITGATGENLLRVPFRVKRTPRLGDREVGYAALTAIAHALKKWGVRRACFRLDDPQLIDDVAAHREVPDPIVLPYVRLRCTLNQLDDFRLEHTTENDLAQRARAEVATHIAA